MKKLLKNFIISLYALHTTSQIAQGMSFANGFRTLLVAGFALSIATSLGKPIINALLLPINLVTFGIFRWLSSAITLYIVTLLVPGFQIKTFLYEGLTSKWLDIPHISFNGILAFIGFSFILSFISSFLHWVSS